MNLEKYKNDGWGLSRKCFEDIINIFNNYNIKNVVEFGSGVSTEFFVDLINDGNDFKILSYDDNIKYATKVKHPNLTLKLSSLLETNDDEFNLIFNKKQYNRDVFQKKRTPLHTRQKNTFYDINENDLPTIIDLMVVDGPNGNGRSVAFLHGLCRLTSGSFVLIDDYNDYDFVEKFKNLYPNSELVFESNTGKINQWDLGGSYVIYKII
jgi:hypothetical protein